MILVQSGGRIEIEVTRDGPIPLFDETSVRDAHGATTRKRRFPEHTYFVMVPEYFLEAKVNKVIGEVWIAKDTVKVREFYARLPLFLWSDGTPLELGALERWSDAVRKPELE